MKKTLKIMLLIICTFIIIALINVVNAASASITSDNEAIIGNVTIKATVTAAQWNLKLSVNGTEITTSSELDNYEKNVTKTIQGTYNAKSVGDITVTLVGDITDINNTNTSINQTKTIKIKEAHVAEPKFTASNQTVYAKSETNIRESYTTDSKSLGMLAAGESIQRTAIGDNGWSKVTYNGKTAYMYSNNLTTTAPNIAKSTDKSLKSLTIAEGKLDPEFSAETTKYSVSVPNNTEKATIEAIPNSEKAKVEITGNEKLVQGSNLVKITVTAEDGTTRIYNLDIVKTNQEPIQLKILEIPGVTLEPAFSPDVTQYRVKLDSNSTVTDFAIHAEAAAADATVEIIGNSNFQKGENIITILVTSADGKQKTSYQIIADKSDVIADNKKSSKNDGINIALVIIGALIVVAIGIIIVALIKKRRAEQLFGEEDDDDIDPYRPSFNDDDLDTDEDVKKEDFTGVFKQQILPDDEMEDKRQIQQTGRFETQSMPVEPEIKKEPIASQEYKPEQDEDYIPDTKQENNVDNTIEMTRRFSTNYDYTLEQYKKNKNTGKGRHF